MKRFAVFIAGILLLPTTIHSHEIDDKAIDKIANFYRYKGIVDPGCMYIKLDLINDGAAEIVMDSAFREIERKQGIEAARQLAEIVYEDYPGCKYSLPQKFIKSFP